MQKNNIIDLTSRLGRKVKPSKSADRNANAALDTQQLEQLGVLDMTERRQEIINEERRKVRRTILTGFVGAHVVLPQKGLMKVDIYDISETGIAFDIEEKNGHFSKGEEVAMRVYLSPDTYFPFIIKIQNYREIAGEAAFRHGANFVKGTINDEALHHFVKFIETVSASLEHDRGDVMVSNLKK